MLLLLMYSFYSYHAKVKYNKFNLKINEIGGL